MMQDMFIGCTRGCRILGGVVAIATLVGCTPDSTGIDAAQLESTWSSSTTSAWVSVSSAPVAEGGSPTREDVVHAFETLVSRRVECGRRPSACDVSRLAVQDSRVSRQLSDLMAERIDTGIIASDRGRMRYEIESVEFDGPTRANVTTCLHDDTVLLIESGVYDDSVYSARSIWTLVENEGEWLWSEERVVEWVMEGDLCAAH